VLFFKLVLSFKLVLAETVVAGLPQEGVAEPQRRDLHILVFNHPTTKLRSIMFADSISNGT
jgi:hypothetical protein